MSVDTTQKDTTIKVTTAVTYRIAAAAAGFVAATLMALAMFATAARAEFDITQFAGSVAANEAGDPLTQAGAHPYSASTWISFSQVPGGLLGDLPDGNVKTIQVDLPPGFTGDPTVTPKCTEDQLASEDSRLSCPPSTQVGLVKLDFSNGTTGWYGLFNMVPTHGVAASFGFNFVGTLIHLNATVRTGTDYGLRITVPNISQGLPVIATAVQMWGVPAAPANDDRRCLVPDILSDPPVCNGTGWDTMPHHSDAPLEPFLTNPADCTAGRLTTHLLANSWQDPDRWSTASFDEDVNGVPMEVENCEALAFSPTIDIETTTKEPDTPTGLNVDIDLPVSSAPEGRGTPPLKDVSISLPEGMTINPAAADGLGACTDEQLGLGSQAAARCPLASKIGTAIAETPALEERLEGGVYIRSQASEDPESGEMFRLALVIENEARGLVVKLPGSVIADAQTGRLEARFNDNPQLPVSKVSVRLKDGPRAPLATPATCGPKTIATTLTSWAGQTASPESTVDITCPGTDGFAPKLMAGSLNPVAGASGPFSLTVSRQEGEEELKSLRQIQLPEGLLGQVASVPLCGETQAAAGNCPAVSRIGHVQAAAGAGSSPLWVPQAGKSPTSVSLAGPYRGAPYSLSIVVPAQAGPFDLGRVVVRSALHVDERTAQLTTGVDESRLYNADGSLERVIEGEMPTILKGVRLRLRELRVIVDREGFMVNPTDCSPMRIMADAIAFGGEVAGLSNRFTAVNCATLGFKPRFGAKILNKGRKSTRRSFNPRMRFVVRGRDGDANIGRAAVTLPPQVILDQSHIRTTCTRDQFAARECPEGSIYGHAKAWSPLLRGPLEGPVYLASNGGARELPDLVADLDGEVRIVLEGWIDTAKGGRIRNVFPAVPDAPVSRFALTMRGGKRGLLVNSKDLCRDRRRGVANFQGQNGARSVTRPRIGLNYKGCAKVRKQVARKKAARRKANR